MMYTRAGERETDPAKLLPFMRAYPFATIISAVGGEAAATHLPVILHEREGGLVIAAHMARANPHWRQFEAATEALVIFQGPHAYISPAWYEERLSVPTWDYVAVHARGPVRLLDTVGALHHVAELIAANDLPEVERSAGLPRDWLERLAGGIVAFEIAVASLEGRFKLSQNRSATEQATIARELSVQSEPAATVGAMIGAQLHT